MKHQKEYKYFGRFKETRGAQACFVPKFLEQSIKCLNNNIS